MRFLVVEAHTSYNVLLGRPFLNTLGVVVSTPHLAMKLPSASRDIITIHGDQKLVRECYIVSLRPQELTIVANNVEQVLGSRAALIGEDLDPRIGTDSRIEPVGKTKNMSLFGERNLKVGSTLSVEGDAVIDETLGKKCKSIRLVNYEPTWS